MADDATLDRVLAALANPHRRDIVRMLGLHPCAINQLAEMRALSLPAIHKHVKALEDAGLVIRRKQGRTTFLVLDPRPLGRLQAWVGQFHPYWGSPDATFDNYAGYLAGESRPPGRKRNRQRETQ